MPPCLRACPPALAPSHPSVQAHVNSIRSAHSRAHDRQRAVKQAKEASSYHHVEHACGCTMAVSMAAGFCGERCEALEPPQSHKPVSIKTLLRSFAEKSGFAPHVHVMRGLHTASSGIREIKSNMDRGRFKGNLMTFGTRPNDASEYDWHPDVKSGFLAMIEDHDILGNPSTDGSIKPASVFIHEARSSEICMVARGREADRITFPHGPLPHHQF